jgi:hypothetical protein
MIFKVIIKRDEHVLEIDMLSGIIKLTNCLTTKVSYQIRMPDFNGALQIFDSDEIHFSFDSGKKMETVVLLPFDGR